jgi:hypothetical protein
MAYLAAQVVLFEEPDDYVIENNPDVTYRGSGLGSDRAG